jgi:hypothetical protein
MYLLEVFSYPFGPPAIGIVPASPPKDKQNAAYWLTGFIFGFQCPEQAYFIKEGYHEEALFAFGPGSRTGGRRLWQLGG